MNPSKKYLLATMPGQVKQYSQAIPNILVRTGLFIVLEEVYPESTKYRLYSANPTRSFADVEDAIDHAKEMLTTDMEKIENATTLAELKNELHFAQVKTNNNIMIANILNTRDFWVPEQLKLFDHCHSFTLKEVKVFLLSRYNDAVGELMLAMVDNL